MNAQLLLIAKGLLAILTIANFSPLLAIDTPPDNPKPPEALLLPKSQALPNTPKLPYIGLSTAVLPEMLREHLNIKPGQGLSIRTICPDSPAENAKLSVNDIILSLNGKSIGDPEHFSELIRNSHIGDTVKLEIIRKGLTSQVDVTLTERPAELQAHLDAKPFLQERSQNQTERLRQMMEENMQGFGFGGFSDQNLEQAIREMRERIHQAFQEESLPLMQEKDGGIHFQRNSTVRVMDEKGCLEVTSTNGDTHVTVRDLNHQIVWQGPWNTEADKAAAPAEIRERVNRFKASNQENRGFRFHFGR